MSTTGYGEPNQYMGLNMELYDRIKKEMSEGIVKAILEDAGYRVIDSGIEKVIRELNCLPSLEYLHLNFPESMRKLPDFTVMNQEQSQKFLVEVKYRSDWSKDVLLNLKDQVSLFGEIILISFNANPPNGQQPNAENLPSKHMRCCSLKIDGGIYKAEVRERKDGKTVYQWKDIQTIGDGSGLWWAMSPLQEKFTQLNERSNSLSLTTSIKALSGILN
jgi:hypothetical protein